jgi:hypothetical protein
VDCVHVGATVEEQLDDATCLSDHRTMERRASRMITIQEVWIQLWS